MPRWIRRNRGFLALVIAFVLFRTSVADWNPIPSGSMRPNLLEGDVVLVNRLAYQLKLPLTDMVIVEFADPGRGDVVTFARPGDGTRLIKRVVALPGDVVEMRDRQLRINGVPLSYEPRETFRELAPGTEAVAALKVQEQFDDVPHDIQWLDGAGQMADFGPVRIEPDHYLVLGDNRDRSADSRVFGLVPRAALIGRAERILVSLAYQEDWRPRFERFWQRLD
jgi:signal peptidase I